MSNLEILRQQLHRIIDETNDIKLIQKITDFLDKEAPLTDAQRAILQQREDDYKRKQGQIE
ncbi:MAG: hypothetical protein KA149_08305 [Chitinophagales bacterium]|nr:hypothetical protein [Chitinophagales bacterium]